MASPEERAEEVNGVKDIYLRWSSESSSDQTTASEEESLDEENPDDDEIASLISRARDDGSKIQKSEILLSVLTRHWLPDGPWHVCRVQLLDAEGVKLFKFVLITVSIIILVHYFAIFTNAQRDEDYSLREMVLYDGNKIVLDIVVFFCVGRLYQQDSIDSLSWTLPVLVSAIALSSGATNLPALQHSITSYEMHCLWGWQMWALIALGALPLFGGLVGAHFVYAFRQGLGMRPLVELVLSLMIFLMPYASSPFFHLHHWYYAWLFGMHANLNIWWSRLTMAILWGIYINGIAIFGRDPIMTCAVTLYQSQNQQCPYIVSSEDYTFEVLSASLATDWNNCSMGTEYVP